MLSQESPDNKKWTKRRWVARMKFLGSIWGIDITQRPDDYKGLAVQILEEDDGNWFEVGEWFDDAWLDDLIEVLQQAKAYEESR